MKKNFGLKRRKNPPKNKRRSKRRNPLNAIRRFYLERKSDVSGLSGTGIIAVGSQFPTGRCVMQWQTAIKSMVIYDSAEEVQKVHGHDGKTVLHWMD